MVFFGQPLTKLDRADLLTVLGLVTTRNIPKFESDVGVAPLKKMLFGIIHYDAMS